MRSLRLLLFVVTAGLIVAPAWAGPGKKSQQSTRGGRAQSSRPHGSTVGTLPGINSGTGSYTSPRTNGRSASKASASEPKAVDRNSGVATDTNYKKKTGKSGTGVGKQSKVKRPSLSGPDDKNATFNPKAKTPKGQTQSNSTVLPPRGS